MAINVYENVNFLFPDICRGGGVRWLVRRCPHRDRGTQNPGQHGPPPTCHPVVLRQRGGHRHRSRHRLAVAAHVQGHRHAPVLDPGPSTPGTLPCPLHPRSSQRSRFFYKGPACCPSSRPSPVHRRRP